MFGILAVLPVRADAHAVLLASSPKSGERVATAPSNVTLLFDEPIETSLGSVRVLNAAGADETNGSPFHPGADPSVVAVHTRALKRGSYVVAWRVVSADSHVVSGAFAFGVGVSAGEVPWAAIHAPETGVGVLLVILHIVLIASLLIAVGLVIARLGVRAANGSAASMLESTAWIWIVYIAFIQVFAQSDFVGSSPLAVSATRYGISRLVLIAAGVLGAIALRTRRPLRLLIGAALVATLTEAMAGHAATGSAPVIGVLLDVAHVLAAAAWIGVLLLALMSPTGVEIRRVANVAAVSVFAILLTAVAQELRSVSSLGALVSTAYGRLVCVKAGLFLFALGVALVSRSRLSRGPASVTRTVKIELSLLAVITIVTGVLVETAPPRSLANPAAALARSSFTVSGVRISVEVQTQAGQKRRFRITTTRNGQPHDAAEIRASIRERVRGVGPLTIAIQRTQTGVYVGETTLPFPGRWILSVSARVGDFDENHASFAI